MKKQSLRGKLTKLTTISTILVLFVASAAVFLQLHIKESLTIRTTIDSLRDSLAVEIAEILPTFLLAEQSRGLGLVLDKIKMEKNLSRIETILSEKEVPQQFKSCIPNASAIISCVSKMNQAEVAVLAPIREGDHLFGYLLKAKTIENILDNSQLIEAIQLIVLVVGVLYLLLVVLTSKITTIDIPVSMEQLVSWVGALIAQDKNAKIPSFNFSEFDDLALKMEQVIRAQQQTQKDAELVNFARHVAHDIRSPLSALNLSLSSAADNASREKVIRSAIERINKIANDLLEVKEPGSKNLHCNVAESVEKVLLEKKDEIYFRKLKLEVSFSEPSLLAFIDGSDFERVLSNLLNNAIEASPLNSSITVKGYAFNKVIKIEISDRGHGIPKELLEKLGKEQITTKRKSEKSGSGIGLISSIRMLEKYKSELKIFSVAGFGTRVEILIPKIV